MTIHWRKIDDKTPRGVHLLYFPAITEGRNQHPQMWQVERHPCHYPRKPTHWAPLNAPETEAPKP